MFKKIRKDLALHFLVNLILMIALYKISFSFGIIMSLGFIKEYRATIPLLKFANKFLKSETKDTDDLLANYCGLVSGYLIGIAIY